MAKRQLWYLMPLTWCVAVRGRCARWGGRREWLSIDKLLGGGAALLLLLPLTCTRQEREAVIDLRIWVSAGSPQEVSALRRVIADYERDHPDIRVSVEYVPATRRLEKYLTAMQAGAAPDLVNVHWTDLASLATKEQLLPLDAYIARDQYDIDDFLESSLHAHAYRGQQVSLPDKGSTMVMFYNKDLFDQAGLAYPTSDWTIEQVIDTAIQLSKWDDHGRQRQVGLMPYTPESWIWSLGGDLADDDLSELHFTHPQTIEAVRLFADMRNKWRIATRNMRATGDDPAAVDVFERGHVAMAINGPWSLPKYTMIRDFRWDVAMFPRGPAGRVTRYAGMGYGIWTQSPHPDAAWELLKHLVSRETMTLLRVEADDWITDIPARRSVAFGPFRAQDVTFDLDTLVNSVSAEYADVRVLPKSAEWVPIAGEFHRQLDLVLLGHKTPEQAMTDVEMFADKQVLAVRRYEPGVLDVIGIVLLATVPLIFCAVACRRKLVGAFPRRGGSGIRRTTP